MRECKDFTGLKIITSEHAQTWHREQVRFPRSKKARIRRKWSKQEKNFRSGMQPSCFRMGDNLICHPSIAAQLQREFGSVAGS